MDKFFKWKSYILIGLSVILIFLILADTYSISISPEEYAKIYNFSEISTEWKFKSVINYIISNITFIFFLIIYILLNMFFLIKRNKSIKKTILVIEIVILIYLIINLFISYQNGFDH